LGAAHLHLLARAIDNATKMALGIDKSFKRCWRNQQRAFKNLAFASKSFGVNQEKFSDILKDVNDKFGDYYTTGAGPLADFFENIAPKIGITADAFKGLSSSDALQLYVKSLEDANVSQAEMTFYMEALAGDATLLAPLFSNGGAAIDEFATAAHNAGAIIDEDLINKSVELRRRWDAVLSAMTSKFSSFFMTVSAGFDRIFNISEDEQFVEAFSKVSIEIEKLNQYQRELSAVEKELAENDYEPAFEEATLAAANKQLADQTILVNELNDELTRLNIKLNKRNEMLLTPLFGGDGTPGNNKKTIDELAKLVSAYEALAGSLDPLIAAANEYAKAQEIVNAALTAGVITQDQANVTLEIAKQKLDQATRCSY
jgi:uncharacterized coiled-coil protein SlyX